ncbi:hypothetical protein J6590_059660 [Homalodisca vitripennis]|nr:hypothetical protein J6590_059660 [Homalodisca vitripennis]
MIKSLSELVSAGVHSVCEVRLSQTPADSTLSAKCRHVMAYLYVIFFLAHASTSFAQDCMSCRCFDVEQKAYPISNFVDGSPFYVQSISPPMMYNDYDTICLDFIPINGFVNTTLVQVKYTTNDMKQIPVEYIESQIVPGLFSGVGPSFPDYNVQSAGSLGYKDYVLTESCPNVFLIYRCELIGREY